MSTGKGSGASERPEEPRGRFDNSPYALSLGMKLVELSPGYARVALALKGGFENWEGRPHGGVIMSLADHAFGCAANTLGRVYFAVQFNIHFLSSPEPGDTLYATARVVRPGKKLMVAEMVVEDSRGQAIARASGTGMAA